MFLFVNNLIFKWLKINKTSLFSKYFNVFFSFLHRTHVKYLLDTNCQFAWAIWGERDVRFQSEERRQEYFNANPFKEYQVFQKVIEYIT
jgi:inhibitor of KinA sporulation pathway (predicted exonuclease)